MWLKFVLCVGLVLGLSAATSAQVPSVSLRIYRSDTDIGTGQATSVIVELTNPGATPATFRLVTTVHAKPHAALDDSERREVLVSDVLDADSTYGLILNIYAPEGLQGETKGIRLNRERVPVRSVSIAPHDSAFIKFNIRSEQLGIGRCALQTTLHSGGQVLGKSNAVPLVVSAEGR
jgi:hypothetical protein